MGKVWGSSGEDSSLTSFNDMGKVEDSAVTMIYTYYVDDADASGYDLELIEVAEMTVPLRSFIL